ncbi:MAG: HAD-IA family hydrolase [Candidatus Lokiarchaeota archaeon]|nr:HAD-IA family hydrolase [Candidatus Lokiarchaeota archaeon]MBD3201106.1 HAD-IA family hydrolase [Candidatus Lokiarchaeota archaeon]
MMLNNKQLIDQIESEKIKGIIFDFDGTLLDVREPLENSIREVFEEENIEVEMEVALKEIGAVLESIQGYPLPKIILQSHDIFQFISSLEKQSFMSKLRIATKIFSKYLEYEKNAHIYPKVPKLLENLKLQYDLYIVSHNQTKNIAEHLEKNNLSSFFTEVYGADKLPELKPNPRAFKPIFEHFDPFKGNEFIMIGDMPSDIETGQEAGIWTIAFSSGVSKKDILIDCRPDLLIESVDELYELFGINYNKITQSKTKKSLEIKS